MWNYGEPKLSREEFNKFTDFSPRRIAWFYSMFYEMPEDQGGCWIWLGATKGTGYGSVRVCGSNRMAHRLSWLIHRGPMPTLDLVDTHHGTCICHNCPKGDDVRCVNPAHLFLGTNTDNIQDMERKGRAYHAAGDEHWQRRNPGTLSGCKNGMAKLIDSDVIKILELLKAGELSFHQIGECFGVSADSIGLISRGKTWKHLTTQLTPSSSPLASPLALEAHPAEVRPSTA